MKVLFLHHSFNCGGTETSTKLLSHYLMGKGITTFVCVWQPSDIDFIVRECGLCDPSRVLLLSNQQDIEAPENYSFLKTAVKEFGIAAIINQGPFWRAKDDFSALGCKIISVLHYSPDYKIDAIKGVIDQLYRQPSPNAIHRIKSTVRYWFKPYFAQRDFARYEWGG